MTNLTEGKPSKVLVAFTLPVIASAIFQQLYNIADLVIVGRLLGVEAFASVGAVAPLFFLIMFIIVGLTSGFSVITGQRFGAKDFDGVKNSVVISTFLSVFATLLFTIIFSIFMHPILNILNVPQNIYTNAYWYIEIVVLGLISATFYNLLANIIRALGDSKTPLYFLIVASVANIFLALFFIEILKLGVAGSAIAVILSQGLSVLLCLYFVKKKFPILHLKRKDWLIKFDKNFYSSSLEHLKVGVPMSIQFSIIGLGVIVIQSVCNTFGSNVIAAVTAALRIEQIATLPMISFGVALASFVAQNFGAKKFRRIRTGVIQTSLLSIFLSILMAIIMRYFGADIVREFIGTASAEIIDIAHQYLLISTFFYVFLSQIFIYRNALQGMGEVVFPLVASVAELLMRAFAAVYLAIKFGYIGMFFSGPIAWVSACIILSFGYFRSIKPIVNKIRSL